MTRDPVAVQDELDAAQADLEVRVAQLKAAVADRLAIPKRVVEIVAVVAAVAVGFAVVRAIGRRL